MGTPPLVRGGLLAAMPLLRGTQVVYLNLQFPEFVSVLTINAKFSLCKNKTLIY